MAPEPSFRSPMMPSISAGSEILEKARVLIPDNCTVAADGGEVQELPVLTLLGATLSRPTQTYDPVSAEGCFHENETLSTSICDDLLDSVLDECFESETAFSDCNETRNISDGHKTEVEDPVEQCSYGSIEDALSDELVSPLECISNTNTQGCEFETSNSQLVQVDDQMSLEGIMTVEIPVNELTTSCEAQVRSKIDPRPRHGSRISKKKKKKTRAPARPWSVEEHQRFKESLELFGRNWERCAAYIGTRRAQLVRSHAQKYLIKLWKLGKPLPKKVAESGNGYTLSGKPLYADSASAKSYLTKIPCPNICQE